MNVMNSLVVIASIIMVTYTVAMSIAIKGIPESISATVYQFSKKWEWVFTIVMWLVAFLIVPTMMEKSSDTTRFLAFFTVAGILGVGASPLVAKERNTFHYVCAAVSGIASQVLVALNQTTLLLMWFPYIGYTLVAKDVSRNLFWVEVLCMLNIFALCLTI